MGRKLIFSTAPSPLFLRGLIASPSARAFAMSAVALKTQLCGTENARPRFHDMTGATSFACDRELLRSETPDRRDRGLLLHRWTSDPLDMRQSDRRCSAASYGRKLVTA
jgi:hypothetical protein